MNFQEFVKEKRKEAGLTYYDFAARLGVSWVTAWRWENGHNEPRHDAVDFWKKRIEEIERSLGKK